jgi:enolase
VSLACARAAAKYLCIPLYQYISQTYSLKPKAYSLPRLMLNLINGGRHAAWAFDIQEFMVVPKMNSLTESVRAGSEIFHTLGELLHEKGYSTLVGDEGGYAPEKNQKSKIKNQNYNEIPFQLLTTAAKKAGYKPGKNVFFAIDVAASEFYNSKTGAYELKKEKKNYTAKQLGVLYQSWIKKYPLILIEDPFGEDDWSAWERFNSQLPTPNSQPLVIGDDLFTTNIERLQQGIAMGAANSILIKPNQIGTLTETVECVKVAKKYGMKIVISHRSGETSDSFISDLSVAVSADYIKAGAPSRGERVAKYNRLMEIEQELND